jgi:hypothetical protein
MNELESRRSEGIDKIDDTSRPVASGVGAVVGGAAGGIAGGAAAGAAVGGMTGPVGAAVGAVVGAVAGAVAGKSFAKALDPVAEDAYWRDNYPSRAYASGSTYEEYRPAFGYGVAAHERYPDRTFDEVEPELGRDWSSKRGSSSLEWEHAKLATHDAWQRVRDNVKRATPGDSDRDGK